MKIIKVNKDARKLIQQGINLSADCIKTTLGPDGRNAILERVSMTPLITNDGVTIAQQIESEDETVNLGCQLVKEVSRLSELKAGDGTTTAVVLLQAIVNECINRLDNKETLLKKENPVKMRLEIERACAEIVKHLESVAVPVESREEIYKVAKVSVEIDELAQIITDIFVQIGKDGIITVEEGTYKTEYEVVTGIEIGSGLLSPLFANKEEIYELEQPKILVLKNTVNKLEDIADVVDKVSKEGFNDLIVFAKDFSKDIIETLAKIKVTGEFTVIPLKATIPDKTFQQEDLADLLGTTAFGDEEKIPNNLLVAELGTCKKIIVTHEKATFVGGNGDTKNRVKTLKKELDKETLEYNKEKLQKRISALSGGVAVIRVGAESQSEREYLRLKLDDAVIATKYAMQEGVVKGGGVALTKASEKLNKSILSEVIKAPFNQIQTNSGGLEIGEEVVDPLRVTKTALQNACSVAGMVITTEVAISNKHEKNTRQSGEDNA